jgi:hypothetical protein
LGVLRGKGPVVLTRGWFGFRLRWLALMVWVA